MSAATMTKGERGELRRIVRGDFKALQSEIHVRYAEMLAEIEKRVAQRFTAHEEVLADLDLKVIDIVARANAELYAEFDTAQKDCDGYQIAWVPLQPPLRRFVREKRDEMRRAMIADLDARVAHAKSRMQRQEVDLLKKLSAGALESEEAKAFLTEIPTVAELVPASRLAELEAEFEGNLGSTDGGLIE